MPDSWIVSAIYCDDVRQELNGKTTLVGCYASHLYVRNWPVQLPKLCAVVRVTSPTPVERYELSFCLTRRLGLEVAADTIQVDWASDIPDNEAQTHNLVVELVNVKFESNDELRISVTVGDKKFKGESLFIRQREQGPLEAKILASGQGNVGPNSAE